jgi:hypothetical protein
VSDLLKRVKKERAQILEHAKAYVLKRDKDFRKHSGYTKKVKPIRHPNGRTYKGANYSYYWDDAIWCGDIHLENMLLYFGIPDDGDKSVDFLDDTDAVQAYIDVWNKALKEALPQVYWCVLSGDLDDKPTNPQEEIWQKIAFGEIEEDS